MLDPWEVVQVLFIVLVMLLVKFWLIPLFFSSVSRKESDKAMEDKDPKDYKQAIWQYTADEMGISVEELKLMSFCEIRRATEERLGRSYSFREEPLYRSGLTHEECDKMVDDALRLSWSERFANFWSRLFRNASH